MSCILWTGKRTARGYGQRTVDGKVQYVHRLAYVAANGLLLCDIKELKVCHTCDIPSCYNPEHLFLGTQKDNMLDCAQKDRTSRAKLTNAQAVEIRQLYVPGLVTQQQLADTYGVTRSAIGYITRGEVHQ